MVVKSAEEDPLERGIDAIVVPGLNKNGILLQWHPVVDNDLIEYLVYRKANDSTGSQFPLLATVGEKFEQIDTFFVDSTAQENVRYYYYVIAHDEADQFGERSRKDDYKLIKMSAPNSPSPTDTTFSGIFKWTFPVTIPADFIFRLEVDFAGNFRPFKIKTHSTTNYSREQSWSLSDLGIDPLPPGVYRWRIDNIGGDSRSGSESDWLRFSVQ
ncbi:MAG: hypothetical protein ACE5GL_00070 [Calditrichia bacterium]